MTDESDGSSATDDLIRRLDARLTAAEVDQSWAADVAPAADETTSVPRGPDERPADAGNLDTEILVDLERVLRNLDSRIERLGAKVDGLTSAPSPTVHVPDVVLERLDHLDAQVTALGLRDEATPLTPAIDPEVRSEFQQDLDLLRNQLENAFYEADVADASHRDELRKLAEAVTACVEELAAMRRSNEPEDMDSGDIASGIERLEKGLHELSESTADLGTRTSLDIERLERALSAVPQSTVDATDVVRKVDEHSLHLAADIASLRSEVTELVRALGAQENTVRALAETTNWLKQRLLH